VSNSHHLGLDRKAYYCYKTGGSSLNTQVFIGPDKYIEYVSEKSLPYARWVDINMIKIDVNKINEKFPEDKICLDKGYVSADEYLTAQGKYHLKLSACNTYSIN
jgi:hypothetical protein